MENVCAGVCIYRCFMQTPEDVGSALLERFDCINDICGLRVSLNETENVFRQIEETYFPGGGRNWSKPNVPGFDVSTCSENMARRLDLSPEPRYTIPINGYLSPILILFSIFNNFLVCLVLLKPHMRSPTTIILIAMAFSDMMTGLFPLPFFIYFYTMERVHEWVPYQWCDVMNYFLEYIPTIFHTASIWLTMTLAVQRYICVCHVFKARALCTVQNTRRVVLVIFLVSTLSHISRFFETYPVETTRISLLDPNTMVSACTLGYRPWFRRNTNLYFNLYFWFRVIFIHFLPCVSLVVMTVLLIYAMRVAQHQRKELLFQNKKSESRQLTESNRFTMMLVAVVCLFLLVELPLGMIMVFLILENNLSIRIVPQDMFPILSLFSNFFILLSYPLNFFIYCGMSKQFRNTFKRIFTSSPEHSVSGGSPITPV